MGPPEQTWDRLNRIVTERRLQRTRALDRWHRKAAFGLKLSTGSFQVFRRFFDGAG